MSGLYVHIPYCKQACNYCDFHFSTSLRSKDALVDALLAELELRRDYLTDRRLGTIYFGGGTPSLLPERDLFRLFEKIYKVFDVARDAEITLECNPDDLSDEKLKELKRLEVNRLSIGLQSFNDEELRWMNRAHTASESEASVKRAQDRGFENITIDLIYGSKFSNLRNWRSTLDKAIALGVPHVSSYNLTVEEKTRLGHDVKVHKEAAIDDELSAGMFLDMTERLQSHGFVHYEISNFGKEGFFSIHNTNYWKGRHYLGIGPSAHSFDGVSRQWNVSNNNTYIRQIAGGEDYFEKEVLSDADRFNEYMLIALRTMWGVDLAYLKTAFDPAMITHFITGAEGYIVEGNMRIHDGHYILTEQGRLLADRIAGDLFV